MATLPSKGTTVQRAVPVAASSTITVGDLVMINSAGFFLKGAAAAGNKNVVGVAAETVDNSSGANGAKYCKLEEGLFRVTGASLAAANAGDIVYLAAAGNAVDLTRDGATYPFVGIIKEFISATAAWVQISSDLAATYKSIAS